MKPFNIDYTPTRVALIAVPEPSAAGLLLGGLGALAVLRRRRPN